MKHLLKRIALSLVLFVALASAAFGQTTFTFSFTGTGITLSGTLTATLVSGGNGAYLVTALSGTQNGVSLSLLPQNSYELNYNYLYPSGSSYYASFGPLSTGYGLGFVSSTGTKYELYYYNSTWFECNSVSGGCGGAVVTGTVTQGATLSLAASPTAGSTPLTVNFTATCSVCLGYIWNFGDGTSTAGVSTSQAHTYTSVGTYHPTAYSVDANGVLYSATVTISAPTIQHSVNLSWNFESGVAGYNVYRGSTCGPYTKINSSLDANTAFTDSTVASGSGYCYTVAAIDSSGNESGFSNQTTVVIPTP